MANIDTSKLVNLGNLQYYDQKIKNYTEEKIKGTNLSDLADDAEHRTVTDTEKASWNAKSDFSGSYDDLSDVPSDLATTSSVASALSEAKTYTDEELAKFDFIKVADSLPETGLPNKIYLVPKTDTQTQDLFDEWIYINKGTEDAPEYVWEWVTTKQLEVDLTPYATTEYVDTNKVQIVTTEGTGSAYTATVPGITALTPGVSFVMIPHVESSHVRPALNVNGLGSKGIRRQLSYGMTEVAEGYTAKWLLANNPYRLIYNGTYWIVENLPKPFSADLYGTISLNKGGTGRSTLTSNAILAGPNPNATEAADRLKVNNITTASGALYATEENGVAQFGTLPIAQGGTGATSDAQIVANLKSALVDLIYPIGSVYMSFESTNPETLFGGTWERLKDAFLWASGDLQSITYTKDGVPVTESLSVGGTGGELYHQLTNGELPAHSHEFKLNIQHGDGDEDLQSEALTSGLQVGGRWRYAGRTYDTGNNWHHNNMPPYLAVYMWKRVSHVGHATWTSGDIVVTPSLSASGRNLTATYTTSINNSSYITTNNLRTTYTWYYQGNLMSDDTSNSIYMDNIGTYEVRVNVSGTLIDNEGCSSYINRTGTASYTFNG